MPLLLATAFSANAMEGGEDNNSSGSNRIVAVYFTEKNEPIVWLTEDGTTTRMYGRPPNIVTEAIKEDEDGKMFATPDPVIVKLLNKYLSCYLFLENSGEEFGQKELANAVKNFENTN